MQTRLTPELLLSAYSQGYFPMPGDLPDEIFWYRPDPRAIIPLDGFHVSRSLQRRLRRGQFTYTFNLAFPEVMAGCSDRITTWINDEFKDAYSHLHQLGFAHSVEIWQDAKLVGGVYGVAIGGAFFAESMFHRTTDASKAALYYLVQRLRNQGFSLLECQFLTPHLESLGATAISDEIYIQRLTTALAVKVSFS